MLQEERQNRAVYDIAADVDGDDAVDLIFGTNTRPTMGDGQEPMMLLRNLVSEALPNRGHCRI